MVDLYLEHPTHKILDDLAGRNQNWGNIDAAINGLLDSAIIDHNLNVSSPPNGYYVRYANGLQICFGTYTEDRDVSVSTGALYVRNASFRNYAKAFSAPP